MKGNDQVRFCDHCDLHVTDLSALTHYQALRLVERSRGHLCVRYVQTASGEILTRESQQLHQLGRRVSRLAAGAFTAAISISTAAAQTSSEITQPVAAAKVLSSAAEGGDISGVVTDPSGAVVPGATVTLIHRKTSLAHVYVTREDGAYKFTLLETGRYSIEAEAPSFVKGEYTVVDLRPGSNEKVDFNLRIPEIFAEVEIKSGIQDVPVVMMGTVAFRGPQDPLIKAAYQNELASVATLIPVTPDINANDSDTGVNAISYAITNNNHEMVSVLLSAGATLKNVTKQGRTPLMYLNNEATVEFLRALISAGADVNGSTESAETVLMAVATSCKIEVFKELVAAGAKLNVKDDRGNTILMRAAENDDPAIVRLLIAAGVSIDARNEDGESALTFAVRSGKGHVLRTLINGGAAINLKSSDLDEALRTAIDNEDSSTVRIMLDAGANPNTTDSDHKTALMQAAANGKPEAVKALINAGADLNAVDDDGWTALMYCDDVESLRALLNAGADPNVRNKKGETVLAIASEAGQEDVVKLLKSRGAPE
jgi:ankyrin repeat protein